MNVQAVKDWLKTLPKEEGDNYVLLIASDKDFAFKVDATVGDIAGMLLRMAIKNPDFRSAVVIAAARMCEEGGEE